MKISAINQSLPQNHLKTGSTQNNYNKRMGVVSFSSSDEIIKKTADDFSTVLKITHSTEEVDEDKFFKAFSNMSADVKREVVVMTNNKNENILHRLSDDGRIKLINMFKVDGVFADKNAAVLYKLFTQQDNVGNTPLHTGGSKSKLYMMNIALGDYNFKNYTVRFRLRNNVFNMLNISDEAPQDTLNDEEKVMLLDMVKDRNLALTYLAKLTYKDDMPSNSYRVTTFFKDCDEFNIKLANEIKKDEKLLTDVLLYTPIKEETVGGWFRDKIDGIPQQKGATFIQYGTTDTVRGVMNVIYEDNPNLVYDLLLRGPSVVYSVNKNKLEALMPYYDNNKNSDYFVDNFLFNKYVMSRDLFGKDRFFSSPFVNPYPNDKKQLVLSKLEEFPEKLVRYIEDDENYSRVKSQAFNNFLIAAIQDDEELIRDVFKAHPGLIQRYEDYPLVNAEAILNERNKFFTTAENRDWMLYDLKNLVLESELSDDKKLDLIHFYMGNFAHKDDANSRKTFDKLCKQLEKKQGNNN